MSIQQFLLSLLAGLFFIPSVSTLIRAWAIGYSFSASLYVSLLLGGATSYVLRKNVRASVGWLLIGLGAHEFSWTGLPLLIRLAPFIRGALFCGGGYLLGPSLKSWLNRIQTLPKNSLSESAFSWRPFFSFRRVATFVFAPMFFYFLAFIVLTYPLIFLFSTHLFGDRGDGYQMLWNVWWVHQAAQKGISTLFFSDVLFHPKGVTLLANSFHPLKGLMAVPLVSWLGLRNAYNTIFILTFLLNGLFTFLLAYRLRASYGAALFAGFIFAFSGNRFAHADGHLHVISTEWIPLFLLFWWEWLERPAVIFGVLSSICLGLALFCDQYALLYCIISGFTLSVLHGIRSRDLLFWVRVNHRKSFLAFFSVSLLTSGSYCVWSLLNNSKDSWGGGHPPRDNPLDLLGALIPGGHSGLSQLFEPVWSQFRANPHEATTQVGFSVVLILILAFISNSNEKQRALSFELSFLSVLFWILSLGSFLNIAGVELPLSLPYHFLYLTNPAFKLSGMPIRMSFMLTLFLSLLIAVLVPELLAHTKRRWITFALIALAIVETIPGKNAVSNEVYPTYVEYLRMSPKPSPVIDLVSNLSEGAYYQTRHEQPVAFGYLARTPKTIVAHEKKIRELITQNRFEPLCRNMGFRFLVIPNDAPISGLKAIRAQYSDDRVRLFDLKLLPGCQSS